MSKKKRTILAVCIIIASLGAMMYPFISNFIFEHRADSIISTYEDAAEDMEELARKQMWADAEQYNIDLQNSGVQLTDPFSQEALEAKVAGASEYSELLNAGGTGVMSYVEIPKIRVNLPVYHTVAPDVLERGIGHLEGSSLPIGGLSTHCVVSGHTGLNHAKLFTDLTEMETGDQFYFHTLGETIAYEVDQIKVVEPSQVDDLTIVPGEDHATLVTCTPYGINSHRLLVRGKRVPYVEEQRQSAPIVTSSQWMREYLHALYIGLAIVAVLFIAYKAGQRARGDTKPKKKKKKKKRRKKTGDKPAEPTKKKKKRKKKPAVSSSRVSEGQPPPSANADTSPKGEAGC